MTGHLVKEVHDLHMWTITSGFPALSAHVIAEPGADHDRILHELEALVQSRFQIGHTTLQIDRDHSELCSFARGRGRHRAVPPPLGRARPMTSAAPSVSIRDRGGPDRRYRRSGGAMPGQIVHIEIPADDTAKGASSGARSSGGSSRRTRGRSSTT